MILENDFLRVELREDAPVVASYLHKPTGERIAGAKGKGRILANETIPLSLRSIATFLVASGSGSAGYVFASNEPPFAVDIRFRLEGSAVVMSLASVEDPRNELRSLTWEGSPLLAFDDPDYRFWRLVTSEPGIMGKMWLEANERRIGDAKPDASPVPVIHGCAWKSDRLLAFAVSNSALFPFFHQRTESGYAISLNAAPARVGGKALPPFETKIVFLEDLNGDRAVDLSDYMLWMNRRIPDADPIYLNSIWYKIFLDIPGLDPLTTFEEAREMIEAIRNVTDGVPQIAYLVGWQYDGHDTGYPSLDQVNEAVGGAAGLRELHRVCKERLSALVSYHANIDDAYPESHDWDPALMGYEGMLHSKDVASGRVFERLLAMMDLVPIERTIHFDNLRITNDMNGSNPDRVGALEELERGLRPIVEWLRERGITITTEGWNGMPVDLSPFIAGFWHYHVPTPLYQMHHRKMVGGGMGNGSMSPDRRMCGLVPSIHQDFSYRSWEKNALSFLEDWQEIVRRIYLGSLLYLFYLGREMISIQEEGGHLRVRYGDGTEVEANEEHLMVAWGDVTVADDDDRFIPLGDAILAYSDEGSTRDWTLPEAFAGAELELFALSREGRAPFADYQMNGSTIRLTLPAKTPVKIVRKTDEHNRTPSDR